MRLSFEKKRSFQWRMFILLGCHTNMPGIHHNSDNPRHQPPTPTSPHPTYSPLYCGRSTATRHFQGHSINLHRYVSAVVLNQEKMEAPNLINILTMWQLITVLCASMMAWCHGVERDCDVIREVGTVCDESKILIGAEIHTRNVQWR